MSLSGGFGDGTYTLNVNTGGSLIADLAANPIAPTSVSVTVDSALPLLQAVAFQRDLFGYQGVEDTHLDEALPDTEFSQTLQPGWQLEDYQSGQNRLALLQFQSIIGAGAGQIANDGQVSAAQLTYYGTTSVQSTPADLFEVAVPWVETVTPNTFGPVAGVQSSDYFGAVSERVSVAPPGPGAITLDVTSSLRNWVPDPASNHGWVFAPYGRNNSNFQSSEYSVAGERPLLSVYYFSATPSGGPVAAAGGDVAIVEGDSPLLDASGTTHPTENPATLSYAWDLDGDFVFDDATGITAPLPAASDDGVFTVSVKVTDSVGRSSIDSLSVVVENVDPALTVSAPAEITQGRPLSLILGAVDPGDDTISHWTVDWDDGPPEVFPGDADVVDHDYPTTLTSYTVTVSAMDEDGSYAVAPFVVTIVTEPLGPVADAGADLMAAEGALVSVDASGTTHPSQSIGTLTYQWDFDNDGKYDDGTGITSNFTAPNEEGSLVVGLRVIDDEFYVATDTLTLTIVNAPPTLTLSGPQLAGIGTQYLLMLASSDPGDDTITSWEIDWGDGNVETIPGNPPQWPHYYAAIPQQVTISATATDEDGTYASNTLDVTFSPAVVDNGDAGYSTPAGQWLPTTIFLPGASAYRDNIEVNFSSNPASQANWDFTGLLPGQFEVFVSWIPLAGISAQVTYDVYDGVQLEGSLTVDQNLLPVSQSWGGAEWENLGSYAVDNGSLTVTLSDPSGNLLIADAVRIVPTYTVDVGGPYLVNEGQPLALDASNSSNPFPADFVTYSWDLNGDAVFGDVFGETALVPWSALVALGIDDGPANFAPQVRMSNLSGASADSAAGSLAVVNVPPVLTIDALAYEALGVSYPVHLVTTDPSPADGQGTFTYEIDWEGDGTFEESFAGTDDVLTSHVYPTLGQRTLKAKVTDKDSGESLVVEHTVTIANAGDVNVDGTVDGLDANQVSTNFLVGSYMWTDGDLNGDGNIDGLDANLVSQNFNPGPSATALSTTTLSATPLSNTPTLAADINLDGTVDAQDAAIVAEHFGLLDATLEEGDVNGDGRVDGLDANFVSRHLAPQTASASASAAPVAQSPAAESALVQSPVVNWRALVLRRAHQEAVDHLFATMADDESDER